MAGLKSCGGALDLITRTIYGAAVQTSAHMGIAHKYVPFSTLNEKLGIQAGVYPPETTIPTLKYYAIGIGGHRPVAGANGVVTISPITHRATDASLYRQVPFVLRLEDNDLPPEYRVKYGGRRLEEHNGKRYIAYWLKRMTFQDVDPGMFITTVENGVASVVPFVPNNSNLEPTPPVLSPNTSTETDGEYASVVASYLMVFDETDALEFTEACKIIYGGPEFAVISEIALVTAVPTTVNGSTAGGATIQYTEALGAQCSTFIPTLQSINLNTRGFDLRLEFGAAEPLVAEGSYNASRSSQVNGALVTPRS